jgi:hypothetical protein
MRLFKIVYRTRYSSEHWDRVKSRLWFSLTSLDLGSASFDCVVRASSISEATEKLTKHHEARRREIEQDLVEIVRVEPNLGTYID